MRCARGAEYPTEAARLSSMANLLSSVPPWKVRLCFYGGILLGLFFLGVCFTVMPGRSAESSEDGDPAVERALRREVKTLVAFGPRNFEHPEGYEKSAEYLERRLFEASGRPVVAESVFGGDGTAWNYYADWGSPATAPLVVVGAHYDTASDTPGGNDNGTGVAVLLHLAERFREVPPAGSALRLVLFANEEPPHFWSDEMGSLVHARACRTRRENVVSMLSLETMGHYSEAPKSQNYPFPFGLFYPRQGDFIAFVGNVGSRSLVAESVETFREAVRFPSEGGALPSGLPGVGWSDHWSFWQEGFPALMVTDTAPFRDAHYHKQSDRGEQVDFAKLSVVAKGLEAVVRKLTD